MSNQADASYQVIRQPRRPMSYRVSRAILYGVLILFALYVLVPFMWVIFTALKSNFEIAQDPLGLPPSWRFENIVTAWTVGKFGRYFINSVIVTVPIVLLVVSLSCLAGYGLARLRMPGRMLIFYFFLIGADGPLHGDYDPALLHPARYRRAGHLLGDDPAADGDIAALRHFLYARVFQRAALRFDRRRQDRWLQRLRCLPGG